MPRNKADDDGAMQPLPVPTSGFDIDDVVLPASEDSEVVFKGGAVVPPLPLHKLRSDIEGGDVVLPAPEDDEVGFDIDGGSVFRTPPMTPRDDGSVVRTPRSPRSPRDDESIIRTPPMTPRDGVSPVQDGLVGSPMDSPVSISHFEGRSGNVGNIAWIRDLIREFLFINDIGVLEDQDKGVIHSVTSRLSFNLDEFLQKNIIAVKIDGSKIHVQVSEEFEGIFNSLSRNAQDKIKQNIASDIDLLKMPTKEMGIAAPVAKTPVDQKPKGQNERIEGLEKFCSVKENKKLVSAELEVLRDIDKKEKKALKEVEDKLADLKQRVVKFEKQYEHSFEIERKVKAPRTGMNSGSGSGYSNTRGKFELEEQQLQSSRESILKSGKEAREPILKVAESKKDLKEAQDNIQGRFADLEKYLKELQNQKKTKVGKPTKINFTKVFEELDKFKQGCENGKLSDIENHKHLAEVLRRIFKREQDPEFSGTKKTSSLYSCISFDIKMIAHGTGVIADCWSKWNDLKDTSIRDVREFEVGLRDLQKEVEQVRATVVPSKRSIKSQARGDVRELKDIHKEAYSSDSTLKDAPDKGLAATLKQYGVEISLDGVTTDGSFSSGAPSSVSRGGRGR